METAGRLNFWYIFAYMFNAFVFFFFLIWCNGGFHSVGIGWGRMGICYILVYNFICYCQ